MKFRITVAVIAVLLIGLYAGAFKRQSRAALPPAERVETRQKSGFHDPIRKERNLLQGLMEGDGSADAVDEEPGRKDAIDALLEGE
ncbi:MAG: hypothetical protein KY468_17385 [Armatimonadetes bacterium]|nr:hypothetical protein [Armatimonadota bacterium]